MGTTTRLAIPYPEPTDRVMDGDDAMKAIAQRVDAVAGSIADDTGWVNITTNSGFVLIRQTQIRRIGGLLHLRGAWALNGFTANTTVIPGVLPVGFAPTYAVAFSCSTASSVPPQNAWINAGDRNINVRVGATSSQVYIDAINWIDS